MLDSGRVFGLVSGHLFEQPTSVPQLGTAESVTWVETPPEEVLVRRLIASEFMTLDGVMEAPGHEEHPDGKNAWALQHATDDMQRYKIEELFGVEALLLGRVTYQIWAAFWPSAPRD